MSDQNTDPQPVKSDLMAGFDSAVERLNKLSALKPFQLHVQEAQMHARLADYLELAEQEYIRGWTDCELGIRHKAHPLSRLHDSTYRRLSQAYSAGYADCYEYEARGEFRENR